MSYVVAGPQALAAAASDIAEIASSLEGANAAVALPTTGLAASAADQVSVLVASFFSNHGQDYQKLGEQLNTLNQEFMQKLTASAGAYAATEASAVRSLLGGAQSSAQAAVQAVASGPLAGANPISGAFGGLQNMLLGAGGPGALTGGSPIGSLIADSFLGLQPTGLAAARGAPAAAGSIGTAIEDLYNTIEPWVAYGFNVAAYAAGWLPFVGLLAPQINFLYYLFEPMVQSALFNTIDWLGGTISFSQGLSNFWAATTASVNWFIQSEINWVLGFLPPLPPLPIP